MGDDLSPEVITKSLKQLILSFEPHIHQAGSWDKVEDVLLHLEENDRNFHKYEFVKLLKKHLSDSLGDIVADEIDRHGSSNEVKGQTPVVNQISEQIMKSTEFRVLFQDLKQNLSDAANQLLNNFNTEFSAAVRGNTLRTKLRTKDWSDEEDEAGLNSFNQGSLVFMTAKHFNQTVSNLGKSNTPEVRREAMCNLNQIPVVDIAGSEKWRELRSNLLDILHDPDYVLSSMGLRFVTRAFSSTTPKTREVYMLFMDHITEMFQSPGQYLNSSTSDLDTSVPFCVNLIKSFRLINEFQDEAPSYWIRYPERYMVDIVSSTIQLYSLQLDNGFSPLHFIALLDPKASWFSKWMYAKYSREVLLEQIRNYPLLMENVIQSALSYHSDHDSTSSVGETPSFLYKQADVHYAYFIHALYMLAHLLRYNSGRMFFPFLLYTRQVEVESKEIILTLVKLIINVGLTDDDVFMESFSAHRMSHDLSKLDPARVSLGVLRILCREEQSCMSMICNDDIISAILQPLHDSISQSETAIRHSEDTLLNICKILIMVASLSVGRNLLLYGASNKIYDRPERTPADTIVMFTRNLLTTDVHSYSRHVTSEYLWICQYLYSMAGGLVVLDKYSLHTAIANSLSQVKEVLERQATPTPGNSVTDDTEISQSNKNLIHWEKTLCESLLHFVRTPKGVLNLQQTGILDDCVWYIYRCGNETPEVQTRAKPSCDSLITKIASSSVGVLPLESAGYIKSLIEKAWSLLECDPYDNVTFTPKAWPTDVIDCRVHKIFIHLLNALASYSAIIQLFHTDLSQSKTTKDYTHRDVPSCISDLVDRIILVNSPNKIQSLFNYEYSHVFGLRLLSVMISCLDTYLFLEIKYKLHEFLLTSQRQNTINDSKLVIVDMLSVERNYLLVKSYLIGGPSERVLPPRTLSQNKSSRYDYPMFVQNHIPKQYVPSPTIKYNSKPDNELSRFLLDSRKKSETDLPAWLKQCRLLYEASIMTAHPSIITTQSMLDVCMNVLLKTTDHIRIPHMDLSVNDKAVKAYSLSPTQVLGIKLMARYGNHLKILTNTNDAEVKLTKLIACSSLLQQHRLGQQYRSERGFDWFAAIIFILMGGNVEKCWKFLQKLSRLTLSAYLWLDHYPSPDYTVTVPSMPSLFPLFYRTGHCIELVLQSELPLIMSSFRLVECNLALVCVGWLRQCFLNYLDWAGIMDYLTVCFLYGLDYQVYFCVSILKHLEHDIRHHTQDQDLIVFLKEESIKKFHMRDYMTFMKKLESKFRSVVLPELLDIGTG